MVVGMLIYDLIIWFIYLRRKEDGSGFMIDTLIRSVLDVVNFSTLENLKETLANFSKIPRVSLFRVPLFLVYAWSSFGSTPSQETRSKRLDVVEAVFTQICPVLEIINFSNFAAFKLLRDLKITCR